MRRYRRPSVTRHILIAVGIMLLWVLATFFAIWFAAATAAVTSPLTVYNCEGTKAVFGLNALTINDTRTYRFTDSSPASVQGADGAYFEATNYSFEDVWFLVVAEPSTAALIDARSGKSLFCEAR